jgi:hypothetical protein
MIRGIFIAFGITLLLAPVPLAQALGPFVGGYFGISFARSQGGHGRKGLRFGALLGLLALLVSVAVATALMLTMDLNLVLLWLAVGVFTLYTGNLGALGAMYRLLHSSPPSTPSPIEGEGSLGSAFLDTG